MGIFGNLNKPGKSGLTLSDRIAIFGTAMNGDTRGALALRQAPLERAKEAQKQQFAQMLAGKLGPQYAETQGAGDAVATGGDYQWKPPERTSNGLDINSPDLPALMMQADNVGYDMGNLVGVLKAQEPNQPRQIEGPDGVYEQQGGEWKKVLAYPDKPETVSPGWKPRADGNGWEPVSGGPYDPEYIGRAAGTRRDVVVSRPMPQRGGGGGRGGGLPPPPAGWSPAGR